MASAIKALSRGASSSRRPPINLLSRSLSTAGSPPPPPPLNHISFTPSGDSFTTSSQPIGTTNVNVASTTEAAKVSPDFLLSVFSRPLPLDDAPPLHAVYRVLELALTPSSTIDGTAALSTPELRLADARVRSVVRNLLTFSGNISPSDAAVWAQARQLCQSHLGLDLDAPTSAEALLRASEADGAAAEESKILGGGDLYKSLTRLLKVFLQPSLQNFLSVRPTILSPHSGHCFTRITSFL